MDAVSGEQKKREAKNQMKQGNQVKQALFKSLAPGAGETSTRKDNLAGTVFDRRKFSLDFEHRERVRHQDLKNILRGKMEQWLRQSGQTVTRREALKIRTLKKQDAQSKPSRKEFISPKQVAPSDQPGQFGS